MAQEIEETASEFVLVEWTGTNLKFLLDPIYLQHGINRIPVAFWTENRRHFLDKIVTVDQFLSEADRKAGRIIERFATVETSKETVPARKGPGGMVLEPASTVSTTVVKKAKDIQNLAPSEAVSIVSQIFDMALLKSLNKLPLDASVLAAARDQIDTINEKNAAAKAKG